MFKFIWNQITKYISLVDDILVDFLSDIKSLRYQLIIWAFTFNILLILKSPENIKWGIGLLTAVYAFYFYSKDREHGRKMVTDILEDENESVDPPVIRNPEDQ